AMQMKRHVRLLIFTCPLTVRCITAFYVFSTTLSTSDATRRTAFLYCAQDVDCICGAMVSSHIFQTYTLFCKSVQLYTIWGFRFVKGRRR
ncbi:hypothetical protein P692DRAFT_20740977, partial [Suillus brevipes Sb2]